jgi:hypothetical protein
MFDIHGHLLAENLPLKEIIMGRRSTEIRLIDFS